MIGCELIARVTSLVRAVHRRIKEILIDVYLEIRLKAYQSRNALQRLVRKSKRELKGSRLWRILKLPR